MSVAGVEIGGTKVVVTVGEGPARHATPVRFATQDPAATMNAVIEALAALRGAGHAFEAIGIASFGPLALDRASAAFGRVLETPKPGWSGADVVGPLAEAFGVPVVLETDVNAAALAEGRWGAARGCDDHAYVTVGTGVGVGVVAHRRAVHGAGHPEAGHLLMRRRSSDAFAGVCPWHGDCVEGLISGPALRARLGADAAITADDAPVWDLAGETLAHLCLTLVLTTAPQRIVLGGGVGVRPPLLVTTRRHLLPLLGGYLAHLRTPSAVEALVVPAALEHAGLMGALALATPS